MKKTIRKILCLAMAVMLLAGMMTVTASAESSDVKVNIYTKYDVNEVQFNDYMGRPFINDDGRTLCPFRVIADFMGVQVFWDNGAREACFSRTGEEIQISQNEWGTLDYTVRFTIGSNEIWTSWTIRDKNDKVVIAFDERSLMDTLPIIRDGRTYAPVRFLAEAFRYDVGWDNNSRTVMITSPDTEDWGQMMFIELWAKAYQEVKSTHEAQYWVDEYIKRMFGFANGQFQLQGNLLPPGEDLTGAGEGVNAKMKLPNGVETLGWMFTVAPTYEDGTPTGTRNDIFIGEGGEVFEWSVDDGHFIQVLGTTSATN